MDAKHFVNTSRRWMTAALDSLDEADTDFVVHHAAVGLEHMLKAYLCDISPVLIVEGKVTYLSGMLHVLGQGHLAKHPQARMKTITLVEAYNRAAEVFEQKYLNSKDATKRLDPQRLGEDHAVVLARNGVAHAGIHNKDKAREVLSTCIRLIDALLDDMQDDQEAYWGERMSLHDVLLEEREGLDRERVQAKLASALARFNKHYGSMLGPVRRESVLKITQFPSVFGEGTTEATRCPACQSQGWLVGDLTPHHEAPHPENLKATFVPRKFRCDACVFTVEGAELDVIDSLKEAREVDYFPEGWEPDPDWFEDEHDACEEEGKAP